MRISDWSSDVCSSDLHDPAPGVVRIDCQGGYAQIGFDAGRPLINDKARRCGIAALAINNCIHFAALWPEVEALARDGLVAFAFTPSHAWVAPAGGTRSEEHTSELQSLMRITYAG